MSKRSKKRNELRLKAVEATEKSSAGIFFSKIGIKRQGGGENKVLEMETPVRNLGKPELLDAFHQAIEKMDETQSLLTEFFHTDLDLVKIFYGNSLNRLNLVADALKQVPVPPNSRILDIGGGPGHLAFWMTEIWKDCTVTVADKYSRLGYQWAKEIGNLQVQFIDTLLPRLSLLDGMSFDVIVLSRVLSVILLKELPSGMNTFSSEEYFNGQEANDLLSKLEALLTYVVKRLPPNGSVIVVESWSDARVLIFAKVFGKLGLSINLDLFSPDRVSIAYSVIVFSKCPPQISIQNIPLSLATRMDFFQPTQFMHSGAESIRRLFSNPPTALLEYRSDKEGLAVRDEVIEREGLLLQYKTRTDGVRLAVIFPGTEIPKALEAIRKLEAALLSNGSIITRKFLPH